MRWGLNSGLHSLQKKFRLRGVGEKSKQILKCQLFISIEYSLWFIVQTAVQKNTSQLVNFTYGRDLIICLYLIIMHILSIWCKYNKNGFIKFK